MNPENLLAIASSICLLISTPLMADPKPENSETTDVQTLTDLYSGKTQIWVESGGGIHYGRDGQAQAYVENFPKNAGLGTWSVDKKGRVCHQLTWYWPKNDGYGWEEGSKECISHLTDPDGMVWRSWPDDSEWWNFAKSKSLKRGFRFRGDIRRNRRNMGI